MAIEPSKIKAVKQHSRPDILFGCARVPGTSRLVVGSSDFSVYEIDAAADKPADKSIGKHESYVMGTAVAGDLVVSGGYDCTLRWFAKEGEGYKQLRSIDAHSKRIRSVFASPDGKRIVSLGDDMAARLWTAADGKPALELKGHDPLTPNDFPSMLYAGAFSRDGKLLATGDKVGRIVVWDAATGKQLAKLDAAGMYTWDPVQRRHSIGGIRSLAFSPDGKLLAVGGMGKVNNIDHAESPGRFEVFDWQAGKRLFELQLDGKLKGLVECLAFEPGGKWFVGAGGGNAGFIAFVDPATGKILFQDDAPMRVHGLTTSEGCDRLYGVGHNKVVVWEFPAK